ncbi:MAG: hypothetical protein E7193_05975 [Erysipelotrichaceae bacterium]|nr:hypothetical protein [Erysipelotrichaceae bacterium]
MHDDTISVSDEIIGQGFDFLQDEPMNMEMVTVIEDRKRIPVMLDEDKTGMILETVKEMM